MAITVSKPSSAPTRYTSQSAASAVRDTHTEELVIALCGPIGSCHREVSAALVELLEDRFGYDAKIIKLSKLIAEVSPAHGSQTEFERIQFLQDNGNALRRKYAADFLASKAIEFISIEREKHKEKAGDERYVSRRVCYVIDSIKNIEEHRALFLSYREMFYCFGVYAPTHFRENVLQQRGMSLAEVHQLIDRDSGEEIPYGQQVRDTFVHADFFIRVATLNQSVINAQLERYLHLIFGTEVITPTAAETAMHHAWVAAANSACLSRQVGAALTDQAGGLVSVGWNDVPKVGGSLYQGISDSFEPDPKDMRCYNHGGKCYNDAEKKILAKELFEQLKKVEIIKDDDFSSFISAIQKTKIRALIEFSRSIHAEMHALLSAAHSEGNRILDGKLYVTTYPCHSCARHIIAAGIKEVYYIEPYRKSLAIKLHGDAISESEEDIFKVRILPFSGVSPRKYLDLSTGTSNIRKTTEGILFKPNRKAAKPILQESLEGFPTREGIVVRTLDATLRHGGGEADE